MRGKSDAELRRVLSVVEATTTLAEAAHTLNISVRAIQRDLATARVRGWQVPARGPTAGPVRSPGELRDAAFWQKISKARAEEIASLEKALAEVSGLAETPISPPQWTLPRGNKKKSAIIGMFLSDIHAGEVVVPEELLGLNAYGPEICRRRLRHYFAAACEIGPRWLIDRTCHGALLVLGGDMISGDIHEELRMTNALTAHEQVLLAVEEIAAGIQHAAGTFGKVLVVSVAGNHGRTTIKPSQKMYARLNYDTLVAKMLASTFKNDKRVTFQINNARDAIVELLGKKTFITHGDGMGTGGGQGFGGPIFPIARGVKKVEIQQFHANRPFDLLLHGHYHYSANTNRALSNGSVPGYTEYANGLRMAIEPPQQWLFLLHERWGLRERVEIQLGD